MSGILTGHRVRVTDLASFRDPSSRRVVLGPRPASRPGSGFGALDSSNVSGARSRCTARCRARGRSPLVAPHRPSSAAVRGVRSRARTSTFVLAAARSPRSALSQCACMAAALALADSCFPGRGAQRGPGAHRALAPLRVGETPIRQVRFQEGKSDHAHFRCNACPHATPPPFLPGSTVRDSGEFARIPNQEIPDMELATAHVITGFFALCHSIGLLRAELDLIDERGRALSPCPLVRDPGHARPCGPGGRTYQH